MKLKYHMNPRSPDLYPQGMRSWAVVQEWAMANKLPLYKIHDDTLEGSFNMLILDDWDGICLNWATNVETKRELDMHFGDYV